MNSNMDNKILRHFSSYSLIIAIQKHVNSDSPKVQSVSPKCDKNHGNNRSYYKMHDHCCLMNLSFVFT